MRLTIVRHGKAERASATGLDADRALARRGAAQATWLGEVLARRDDRPTLILSSPAVRAAATADLISRALGCPLHHRPALEVDAPLGPVFDIIASLADERPALVGHNPRLSQLVERLIAEPIDDLRTGEAAILELDPARPRTPALLIDRLRADID